VMSRILDREVVVSRGEVKRQVCMEEILLQLDAGLVSCNADIESWQRAQSSMSSLRITWLVNVMVGLHV
jgi:hypothetical protein